MQNNKEQDVANQFIWLVENKKNTLVDAIQSAGVDIDDDISPTKIVSVVKKSVDLYNDSNDATSKKVIFNVSKVISADNSMFSNAVSFEDREAGVTFNDKINSPSASATSEKKWWEKINVDNVLKIGNSLIGAFNQGRVNQPQPQPQPQLPSSQARTGISTGKIIGFSVLGVVVIGIGVVVYRMYKK